MAQIESIQISINTGKESGGGTDGDIYLGVAGREFHLDTSADEEERAGIAVRLRQTEGALDSLAHLIEAAPFPMWYRGPDLRLGLVNNAFVEAVEGRDAADVIARSAELIDGEGEDSALAHDSRHCHAF